MSGILGLFVDRGLQCLLFGGQGALDFKRLGMGQRLRGGGVGNGLGVLLAYLRQFCLGVADAGLLHATGQQRTGQGTRGSVGPPWDRVDVHCGTLIMWRTVVAGCALAYASVTQRPVIALR